MTPVNDIRGDSILRSIFDDPEYIHHIPEALLAAMPSEPSALLLSVMLDLRRDGVLPSFVNVLEPWQRRRPAGLPHDAWESWCYWLAGLIEGTAYTVMPDSLIEELLADHELRQQQSRLSDILQRSRQPGFRADELADELRRAYQENEDARRQNYENSSGKLNNVAVASVATENWKPFPLEVLPEVLRGYALAASRAIGCDPAFVAGPLLVACAAAIGNARRVQLKSGWTEPPVLWLGLVAESGSHKSPALTAALRPLQELQRKALRNFDAESRDYIERLLPSYEKAVAEWKRSKVGGDPPEKPEEPKAWRLLCDDVTIESLVHLLGDNSKGLLLSVDELAGWLGGFDKYRSGGAGNDAAKWLEMHAGRMVLIDRKSGARRTVCIPRASVSVLGGIQPEILARCLTAQHRASGLSARLLLCQPPRIQKRWTDAEIHRSAVESLESLLGNLLSLQMESVENDDPVPILMKLDRDAKHLFVDYYNRHAVEQANLSGELAAIWSKLEAYCPRFAMILHLVRWASGETVNPELIDMESMNAGIALAEWFGNESRRLHASHSESDEDREQRELIAWIKARGGTTTTRELSRGPREFRTGQKAERSLNALVKAGLGRWDVVQTDRRPSIVFSLVTLATATQFDNSQLNDEFCRQQNTETETGDTSGDPFVSRGRPPDNPFFDDAMPPDAKPDIGRPRLYRGTHS